VDSDDVLDDRYIEILKASLDRDGSDVAICGHQSFVSSVEPVDCRGIETRYEWRTKRILEWLILGGAPWNENRYMMTAWGRLIKRDVLKAIDWNFSNYRANEDEYWSLQMFASAKGGVSLINLALYGYRQNPNSITMKKYKNEIDGKKVNKFQFIEHLYRTSLEYLGKEYEAILLKRLGNNLVDFIDIYTDKRLMDFKSNIDAQRLVLKYGNRILSQNPTDRVKHKIKRIRKISVMGYVIKRRIKQKLGKH
ncbi:MAG: hypothetical protein B7Z19_04795, partial [Polynucleobacter sp. 32-46-5]